MKDWKALISLNLALILLLGQALPAAALEPEAEEEPAVEEVLPEAPEEEADPAGVTPPEEEEPSAGETPPEGNPSPELSEEEHVQLQEVTAPLSGTCGESAVWTLDEDGTLTISGSGDTKNYTEDSIPWYTNRSDVRKVVVEEGITAIGDYAFSNCRNLTEAELNSSVLTAIGDYAFQNATALQTVSGNGAAVTAIGSYAFDNCTALTGIDLFSGLVRIGSYAFRNCSKLTAVTLPDSVTTMGRGAFYNCDGLTTVALSDGMAEIPYEAFYDCYYLATVTIPDSVTTIGSQAFQDCNRLKNLELPAGLETIGGSAFYGCRGLQTVTIGDAVTTIGSWAFRSCSGLQAVTIGSGIQTIGSYAFYYCSALQSVTIDTYRMLVDASDAFDSSTTVLWKQADENTALKTWDIGTPTASSAHATLYGDGRLVVSGKGAITSGGWIKGNVNAVIVEDGITSIDNSSFIDSGPFSNLPNLKTVTIGDTVKTIGRESFYNCSGLRSATIGKAIRTIDSYAFGSCSALETVTIDNYEMLVSVGDGAFPSTAVVTYKSTAGEAEALQSWEIGTQDETDATATLYSDGRLVISGRGGIKTGGWNKAAVKSIEIQDGITSIPGSAFSGYTALESVQIGEGITGIPYRAFYGCTALREITLPDSVTSIGEYAFFSCSALAAVSFPENLTSIGYDAFKNCSALREVNLPDRVTTIEKEAFYNCRSIETLRLPENLTTIQDYAFYNCSALRELVIPDRVTTIKSGAFLNAASLEKLTIGKGVRSIGNSAFANCYALKELHWNVPTYETFSSNSAVFAAAGRDSGGFDLYLGEGVQKIPAYLCYTSSAASGSEVNLLRVYNGSGCLQSVGSFAFYRCLHLSSIELGEALTWIGNGSFNTCPSLTAITVPESLGSIGRKAFFRSGLTRLETWSGLTSIGEQAFDECATGFTLAGFADSYAQTYAAENGIPFTPYADEDTATLTVHGNSPFMSFLRSLKTAAGKVISLLSFSNSVQSEVNHYTSSADLVGWNTQPDGSGTAYAKDAQITLDQDTTVYAQWEEAPVRVIASGRCGRDVRWTLDNQGKLTISGTGAMYNQGCQDTEWWNYRGQIYSAVVEDGVTSIGSESFCGCYNLKTVTLGDTVTSIGNWAFENCSALETVYCGADLQTIRAWCFVGCRALKDIWFYDAVSSIDGSAFSNCGDFTMHGFTGSYAETYARQSGYAFAVNEDAEANAVELTLHGGEHLPGFLISAKRLLGRVVSLLSYSQQVQSEYNRYASGANLVGWNTLPNGTGTAYETDGEVTLEQPMELYAQWETARMMIDGEEYSTAVTQEGTGWEYDADEAHLYLYDYDGGDIFYPDSLYLTVNGDCNVAGTVQVSGWLSLENGNRNSHLNIDGEIVAGSWVEYHFDESCSLSINSRENAITCRAFVSDHNGSLSIRTSGSCAIHAKYSIALDPIGNVEIAAAKHALVAPDIWLSAEHDIYLSEDSDQTSGSYHGEAYLCMKPKMWTVTLNANGGQWSDCDGAVREEYYPFSEAFDLSVLRGLISRSGYVLTGWMDADDSHDYPVNGVVASAGDLTLYAQWTDDGSFSIGGTSHRTNQSASGTGWRFTPARNGSSAVLTLTDAYDGGEIFTPIPLQIVTDGTVSIAAGIGKPGVKALRDLDVRVNSGSLTVTAGDGCDAIMAQGNVYVAADGALAAKGGAGGLAIRSMGDLLLAGSGCITLTGGWNAPAAEADGDLNIQNTGDTYLIGGCWYAVSSGNLMLLDEGLKVYAGQSTSDAVRVESLTDARGPYLHTKKKSVSVVLMANGGTLNGEAMTVTELDETADNIVQLALPEPRRTGYRFQGWNTAKDGSGATYAYNDVCQLGAAQDALTLYAQYDIVAFDADETGAIVNGEIPSAAETVLLAMYDSDDRMLGTVTGRKTGTSQWRFDSDSVKKAASIKIVALDRDSRPVMEALMPDC